MFPSKNGSTPTITQHHRHLFRYLLGTFFRRNQDIRLSMGEIRERSQRYKRAYTEQFKTENTQQQNNPFVGLRPLINIALQYITLLCTQKL